MMGGGAVLGLRWALAATVMLSAIPGMARQKTESRKLIPEGDWGGNHVSMMVAGNSARLDFDCAHGTIEGPLTLDAESRFDLRGSFVKEHGGPIRRGEESAPGEPARYQGKLDGDTIAFEVLLSGSGKSVGSFTASLGKAARVHKCL
jgi:hypothetical protein